MYIGPNQTPENIANFYLSKNDKTEKFHYQHMEPERMKEIFKILIQKIKNESLLSRINLAYNLI